MTTLTVNNRKTKCFFNLKIHDILVSLYFLYFLQTSQYILTYLASIQNILILFCHSSHIH